MIVEEKDIIAGKMYQINTANGVFTESTSYFFIAKENGKGLSSVNMKEGGSVYTTGGDLTQSNTAFRGSKYRLLDEQEQLWFQKCIKRGEWFKFNREDYTIPEFTIL